MSNGTPTPTPITVTRRELAKYFPDHKVLKEFENLFNTASVDTPNDIETLSIQIGSADSKATQANDSINDIEKQLKTKGSNVLLWLSM